MFNHSEHFVRIQNQISYFTLSALLSLVMFIFALKQTTVSIHQELEEKLRFEYLFALQMVSALAYAACAWFVWSILFLFLFLFSAFNSFIFFCLRLQFCYFEQQDFKDRRWILINHMFWFMDCGVAASLDSVGFSYSHLCRFVLSHQTLQNPNVEKTKCFFSKNSFAINSNFFEFNHLFSLFDSICNRIRDLIQMFSCLC
jgi:hypothetical protein